MKPVVIAVIFLCAMGVLLWAGWTSASIPVMKVHELASAAYAGPVQVNDGKVASIDSGALDTLLRFKVASRDNPSTIVEVEYAGSAPENFKLGRDVGLRGEFDPARKMLVAHRVITQCPSKYEASKEAKAQAGEEGYSAQPPGLQAPQRPPGPTKEQTSTGQ